MNELLARHNHVAATGGGLQRIVRFLARRARVGASGIEAIDHRITAVDEQRNLSVPQCIAPVCLAHDARSKDRRFLQSGKALRRFRTADHTDWNTVGRLFPKCESQRQGQDQRKAEDPEDRFRLADELLGSRTGQLDDGRTNALRHREAPGR